MKKLISIIILLNGLFSIGQTPANDQHWELIPSKNWDFTDMTQAEFQDSWNDAPCDHSLVHCDGNGQNCNFEPQYYKSENVSFTSEGIRLTAKSDFTADKICCWQDPNFVFGTDENGNPIFNYQTFYYSSGEIHTLPIHDFKYGYIESKIKISYKQGLFPAFWVVRGSTPGIGASEIDIFEMVPGSNFPASFDIMKTNVHLAYDNSDPDRNSDIQIVDYTQWNVYGLEWTPDKITWYFNGMPVRSIKNPGADAEVKIILNLALHPQYFNPVLNSFPAYMDIEYVKVYELKKVCENMTLCNYDFTFHQETVRKSITISDGCTNALFANDEVIMRAMEEIIIKGDFYVPIGADLYLDVNSPTCKMIGGK